MDNKNPYFNASGCADPTAYKALKPIIEADAAIDSKANLLILVLKYIISQSEFELTNRIEIKHKKSGKVYK